MRNGEVARKAYRVLGVLVLLLAYGLRVRDLARRSLWFDEAIEYWVASAPASGILPAVRAALQDSRSTPYSCTSGRRSVTRSSIIRYLSVDLQLARTSGNHGTGTASVRKARWYPGRCTRGSIGSGHPRRSGSRSIRPYAVPDCLVPRLCVPNGDARGIWASFCSQV